MHAGMAPRSQAIAAAAVLLFGVLVTPISAAEGNPTPAPPAEAHADDNAFGATAVDIVQPSSHHLGAEAPNGSGSDAPPACGFGSNPLDCQPVSACIPAAQSATGYVQVTITADTVEGFDNELGKSCDPDEASAQQALPGLVLRAFQRIPLPEPHLAIQPPKGKTLIGLETILSTEAEPFTRALTLLGRRIELRIHATSYEWIHGDGTTQTTDWAGRRWERGLPIDRYITHTYEDTGTVGPQVHVTWSAEYRVGNGAWQPVNGTVERTSPPSALQVLEAEPKLVAP